MIKGAGNPLLDLPGIGWLVGLIDKPLADAGFPLWLAEAVELLAVGGAVVPSAQGSDAQFSAVGTPCRRRPNS